MQGTQLVATPAYEHEHALNTRTHTHAHTHELSEVTKNATGFGHLELKTIITLSTVKRDSCR